MLSGAASGETFVAELNKGEVSEYVMTAETAGLEKQSLEGLQVNSSAESFALIQAAFAGEHSKAIDMISLNAGAAIFAADMADTLKDGVAMAKQAITSGAAAAKVKELATFSQAFKG